MGQFQLFPPPPSEGKESKNPFRKGYKKPPGKNEPASPIPLQEVKDSGKAESVLLQITDTHQFPPPPSAPGRSKSPPSAGLSYHSLSRSISPLSTDNQTRQGNTSNHPAGPSQGGSSHNSSSGHDGSSAVSPQSSVSSMSPVPMRSMFPQFDPKVPLNQQDYHPSRSNDAPIAKQSRKPHLTLSPTSEIDQVLGPKTVPASVLNFPTDVMEPEEIRYSSPQELEMLWEAANGQRPQNLFGTFNLRMTKTGPASFAFGNSQQPFYTLQTYSNDELSISRGPPSKPNNDVSIMTLHLEDRRRREHPNDGLVALLFSRLAAMLAIEQAGEISKQHHLAGSEAAGIESNALQRAAAQESCRLSWNRNLRLYELRHPSLSKRQPPALVGAAGIPLSPVRSQSSGMLYITVSAPSSDASTHQPPTIIVTGPPSSTAMEAAQQAANPRTSTLPVTDSDEPLAVLDFGTRTLTISPAAVIATIPSLYAVDSLVAAILAVAVSDEATNPILADMELGSPCPSEPTPATAPSHGTPFRGKLITTLAEREDYRESLELASQIDAANADSDSPPKRKGFFKFWNRKKSIPPNGQGSSKKKQKIVVEEFDLEKYGRYGKTSSREGQKLPSPIRGVLKIMFWGLNMMVKVLTLLVKIVAKALVHSTRCLTSEKF
ncbi:hypothetical protein N7492_008685 [Penicillium capsulatum]|uniref:Uncharacterized protein n=1 Tax=Penicillium capsulatum TaxID=69766 RepID=A0A9W9HRZ2_9EURO|nr:hypothetical protein N7492_008685 [Penicillium capsulatum]KAJ6106089.1 hypothetical protein N7512_009606 [Penicillium capsulatum]